MFATTINRISRWVSQHPRLFFVLIFSTRLLLLPPRIYFLFRLPYNSEYRYWWDVMSYFMPHGQYPYLHYWSEYPPFYPWLLVGLYQISTALFSGVAAQTCFWLLMGTINAAAEAGALALLYSLARLISPANEKQPTTIQQAVVALAIFLPPVYLWTGWWDTLPLLLMLAALVWLFNGHERRSAALAGVGIITKLFPLFVIPVAICSLPTWRRKIIYGLIAGWVAAGLLLPFVIANPAMVKASFQNILSRPSWETIWALADGYYEYGVVADFPERLNPASALEMNHTTQIPSGLLAIIFGPLWAWVYLRLWNEKSHRRVTVALTLSMCLLLIYSKGYSPQYFMWVAPLIAIVMPNRWGARALLLLTAVNFIELPIYITFFPKQTWLLYLTVGIRTLVFLGLAGALTKEVLIREPHAQPALAPEAPA